MNVFLAWLASERIFHRTVCFKGADASEFNKPTPQEGAFAEVAAQQFNEYLKGKPYEEAYLKSISQVPAQVADKAQGMAATDLAVKAPVVTRANPNNGMAVAPLVKNAGMAAKTMADIDQAAVAQQAAGQKAFIENAMGMQTTADTARAGLAEDAVRRNIADADADYRSNVTGKQALTSLAGGMAALPLTARKEKTAA